MEQVQEDKPKAWVTLARLLRPQGRKGELLAELLTDFPELFADRQGVSLLRPNGVAEVAKVESHWLPVGRNAGRIVLKLEGVDSINQAEQLANCDLVVPRDERVQLNEADDEHYVADLLECTLYNGDRSVGLVGDVHFPTDSAGVQHPDMTPLLVVQSPDGDELLIPFAKAWIERIDVAAKRIVMRLPEGLLEINSWPAAGRSKAGAG